MSHESLIKDRDSIDTVFESPIKNDESPTKDHDTSAKDPDSSTKDQESSKEDQNSSDTDLNMSSSQIQGVYFIFNGKVFPSKEKQT